MEILDQVLVGSTAKIVFICVEGRGNFQNSHPLKEYVLSMMEKGHHDFVVNLEKCSGMDSTFMGILAGVAILLKKNHQKSLKLIYVSHHNRELLETLGLMNLFEVVDVPASSLPTPDALKKPAVDKAHIAQHMLEAHETLSQLSEMNKIKFKNVIETLRENLKRKSP